MSALLEVEDLCVQFRTHGGVVHAVDGVSYSVDAGKTLMVDGDAVVRAADEAGICIVGRETLEHRGQ